MADPRRKDEQSAGLRIRRDCCSPSRPCSSSRRWSASSWAAGSIGGSERPLARHRRPDPRVRRRRPRDLPASTAATWLKRSSRSAADRAPDSTWVSNSSPVSAAPRSWSALIAALVAATYAGLTPGLAVALGVAWSLVNLALLERLVVALTAARAPAPSGLQRLVGAALGMLALFGAGGVLLLLLPPMPLLAGFAMPVRGDRAQGGSRRCCSTRALWRRLTREPVARGAGRGGAAGRGVVAGAVASCMTPATAQAPADARTRRPSTRRRRPRPARSTPAATARRPPHGGEHEASGPAEVRQLHHRDRPRLPRRAVGALPAPLRGRDLLAPDRAR